MKHFTIFSLLCINLLFISISAEAQQVKFHRISTAKAYKMISELQDYVILDVRTESEYRKKHIPEAVWIPFREINDRAEKEIPDKNVPIFVHCRNGGRSTNAARNLVKLGYKNVYDFRSIRRWPGEMTGS